MCDGLILYATMDTADISGTIVKDVSGPTVHDGTMTQGFLASTTAKVGQGLEFNCEPAPHLDFGSHAELAPPSGADFSGAIWVKSSFAPPNSTSPQQVIVSNEGLNKPGWLIYRTNINLGGTSIKTVVRFETATGVTYEALLPLMKTDIWHHIAFVLDGSSTSPTLRGYFDGVAVTPVPILAGEDFSSSGSLLLGSDAARQIGYCGEAD
ncbi:MAG: LamG-like jellyroll fold domain-containing protein, partial [Verrucomicrobiales bacterium]